MRAEIGTAVGAIAGAAMATGSAAAGTTDTDATGATGVAAAEIGDPHATENHERFR